MKKILKGFTLAEVLITLGIIGVVAAVTLPSLQVNVNKQALSTQISKTYSQLSEGIKMYMVNENLENFGDADLEKFAKNYLQVQYVCADRKDSNCLADSYTYVNSGTTLSRDTIAQDYISYRSKGYILKDGTAMYISPGYITFDVNNKKGPNKLGYDLFTVYVDDDGSIGAFTGDVFYKPEERDARIKRDFEACKKDGGEYGIGCFVHLLRNNFKFDY